MKNLRVYGLACLAVAAALLLRYLLNPLLGQQGPYLILVLPVVLTALYGGFGPAAFATTLGAAFGTYLFVGGVKGFAEALEPANAGRTVLFFLIGISIAVIGGRLAQSRQALAASVRDLRASNKAKDAAMATLGHEIRNPLSAIHTAQNLLKKVPGDVQRVAWAAELIGRQVIQIKRMADDLVDLSSVLKGEFKVRKQLVDMHPVLAQAVEQCQPLLFKKGHRLECLLAPAPVTTLGDHVRLVQVFANLLNNAAKYTAAGGSITLGLQTTGARIIVFVRDSGAGMSPESIEDLFEPFVQAPEAWSNSEGGLGLGLALVRKLVTVHGGLVRGESEGVGRGSLFTVELPLVPAAPGEVESSTSSATQGTSTPSVIQA